MNMKKIVLVLTLVATKLCAMQPSTLPCTCQYSDQERNDAYNINLFINALYWQPREEGLEYMIRNNSGAVYVNNASVVQAKFDWNGGFRVGAGYCDSCCAIGASAYYTRFTTNGSNQVSTQYPTVLFPIWSNPKTNVIYEQQAQARLCLSLDMIDAQLNTTINASPCVDFIPLIGFRYAHLQQNFNINANSGQTLPPLFLVEDDAILMKSKFNGFGPKFGIDTTWGSWCGLSVFGSMELVLLYGKFELSQKETVQFEGEESAITYLNIPCYTFYITRPTIGCIIGLQWKHSADCYDFTLSAGWENQFFFGQNQWLRFTEDINPGINMAVRGDLALQGLTASLNIAF